jgi:drug/metabolite transporter (DMT)-like permease
MGRGPLFMVTAMLCFAVHDAIGKHVTGTASIPQMLAIEAALALTVLTPWLVRRGFSVLIQVQDPWLHALRVALVVGEMACLYAALRGASLTDVIVLYQVAPALTVVMASFVLGERPGPLGWMSILLGFAGVLLIVKPDEPDVSTAHAIALLGMSLYAAFNLLTRQLRAAEPGTLLGWHMSGMLIAGLLFVPFHWQPLDFDTLSLLAVMGMLATLGALLVNAALAMAQTPRIMPLHYTVIVWAMLFSWLFWGEPPDISTIFGAILIVLSGLLSVRFVAR